MEMNRAETPNARHSLSAAPQEPVDCDASISGALAIANPHPPSIHGPRLPE